MAFKHWKLVRQLPPLGEWVVLFRREDGYRQFYRFGDDGTRLKVIRDYGFTHWREEMTCDYP